MSEEKKRHVLTAEEKRARIEKKKKIKELNDSLAERGRSSRLINRDLKRKQRAESRRKVNETIAHAIADEMEKTKAEREEKKRKRFERYLKFKDGVCATAVADFLRNHKIPDNAEAVFDWKTKMIKIVPKDVSTEGSAVKIESPVLLEDRGALKHGAVLDEVVK